MTEKDYDLRLWGYIQSKSTFFGLPIKKVTQLLENDFLIKDGITKLKLIEEFNSLKELKSFKKFPEITKEELEGKYKLTEMEGFESKIYKGKDKQYLYKLTNPEHKIYSRSRFNVIIMYYILQDYLFNEFKYEDLKICGNKMFMSQLRSESLPPNSIDEIKPYMINDGYKFIEENRSWIKNIEDIIVIISDLTPANCRINGSKLEVFDPAIKIDYYKKYSKFLKNS